MDNGEAITDERGIFTINASAKKISIIGLGYKTGEFLISKSPLPKHIALERDIDILDEVSITAYGRTTCSRLLGAVTSVKVISRYQKIMREVKQWLPDPALRIFPNPVRMGQILQMQLFLSTPGLHALKVFTEDGKLIHAQQLTITSNKQLFQFPISSLYPSGIYWIEIQENSGKRKSHEAKFIVR